MRSVWMLGLLLGSSGCLMSGNYHSAKTLARYLANLTSNLEVLSEDLNTINFLVHIAWTGSKAAKR